MTTPTGREYVDDVRRVDVADGRYGDFSWTTDMERLQFERPEDEQVQGTLDERGDRIGHS